MTRTYLAVGALATAAYVVAPSNALYLAVGMSCVAAILVGIRLIRPVNTVPWYLMAAGQAAWVLGDVLYDAPDLLGTTVRAYDLAYLVAYPVLTASLAVLIHVRRTGRDVAGLIDSAIVTIAFGLLSWVLVAEPIVGDSTVPWVDRAVAVAYPAADIVLLGMVVRLVAAPGTRSTSFRLLVAATLLLLVSDTVFAMQVGTAYAGVLDVFWLVSYVLWGAAALHPTMARLSSPAPVQTVAFTGRRLVALAGAVLIAPVLVIVQVTSGLEIDTWTIVLGASVLSLLVVLRMACNIQEIRATTRQRDELQSELFHEASHDSLTGIANNAYLRQLVGSALRRSQLDGSSVGLLLVDIDDFDQVNDRHGHGIGDAALRGVASRLRMLVRTSDTVGRLGGDQFVVLLDPVASDHDAMTTASRLLSQLNQPVEVSGLLVPISASIGATTSMDGGIDPDELLHQASVAVRRAKASGRGQIEVFDARLRHEIGERVAVEAALSAALDAGELEVHYHPVVAVQTGIVDGYEAQLRWNRPGHGLQDPEAFLSVVGSSELICRIDRWVLAEATSELAALTAEDPDRHCDLTVAVTVSDRMLASPRLLEDVQHALDRTGLEPHRLTIGVAEMALVDVPNAVLPLSTLRHAGVFVSINRFGTGRTPLAQLANLPADAIKVDTSMMRSTEPGAHELLALLAHAAHSCGLLIVAEGVERAEQLAELRLLACDSVQGIYSASPDPAADLSPSSPSGSEERRLRVVRDTT